MPTQQALLDLQYDFNSLKDAQSHKHAVGTKMARQNKLAMVATYDFAVQGGAIGAVSLIDANTGKNAVLPKGAIITGCIIDTITALTSGGSATVALGTGQAANDLKAALAYGSYTALVAGIPVFSAATSIKLTADSTMSATIATAALTAGKLNIIVEYVLSI